MNLKVYKKELKTVEIKSFIFLKKHIISLMVSLFAIIYIISKIDFKEAINHIIMIKPIFILIVFLVNLLIYSICVLRWRIIIQKISKVRYLVLFPIFLAGCLINQLTPGAKSGGQPLRAYYLSKLNKKDYADNLATVLFEFFSGALTSLMLVMASLIYLSRKFPFRVYSFVLVLFVLTILLALSFAYIIYKLEVGSPLAIRILRITYRIKAIKKRYKNFISFEKSIFKDVREFSKETLLFLDDRFLWLKQMFLESTAYLLVFFNVFLLFKALGSPVPFIVVGVVTIISEMIGFILLSPGGLGVTEGSMVGLYFLFGINPEIAAAVTIINRVIIYVYEFFLGYISFAYLKKKYPNT